MKNKNNKIYAGIAIFVALMMSLGVSMAQNTGSDVLTQQIEIEEGCLCSHAVGDEPLDFCPSVVAAAQAFIDEHGQGGNNQYVQQYQSQQGQGMMTTGGDDNDFDIMKVGKESFGTQNTKPNNYVQEQIPIEELLQRAQAIIDYCQEGTEPGDWYGGGGGSPFVNAVISCVRAALLTAGIAAAVVGEICFNLLMTGWVGFTILQILYNYGLENFFETVHTAWQTCFQFYYYLWGGE